LLERAISHRSWARETSKTKDEDQIRRMQNESFEFLGDSVLGLAIAEILFQKHDNASEGDLTLMKHRIVSRETLAKIADRLNLGDFMRLGRGEEKTGGRTKEAMLADTLEAIIGAVFIDGGYIAARSLVKNFFRDEIRTMTPEVAIDYKTLLQEKLQAAKLEAPKYNLIKSEGPDHNLTFFVEVICGNKRTSAQGNSIKAAEMLAASIALKDLDLATKMK